MYERYATFGSGIGIIDQIISHRDFDVNSSASHHFFLSGPPLAASVNYHKLSEWRDAIEEYDRVALCGGTKLLKPFTLENAFKWIRYTLDKNYRIHDTYPNHPILGWIKNPDVPGTKWYAPLDGLIARKFRALSDTDMLARIDIEIPSSGTESNSVVFVLFSIFGKKYCRPGSEAAKVIAEVAHITGSGMVHTVIYTSLRDKLTKLSRAARS